MTVAPTGGRGGRWRRPALVVAAALAPPVVVTIVGRVGSPGEYRVGVVFVALAALAALVGGLWPGATCAVSGAATLWLAVYPQGPGGLAARRVDLTLFAVSVAAVVALVVVLRRSVAASARTARMLEDFVAQAPVGIALLDADLRFRAVNDELERIDSRPAAGHLGRRLSEIEPGPAAEQIEALMRSALDTGQALRGRLVSSPFPDGQLGWFKVSYLPLDRRPSASPALAAVVDDVTCEQIAQQRAELISSCGEALARAASAEACATSVVSALVPGVAPMVAIALPSADGTELAVAAAAGFADPGVSGGAAWPVDADHPMSEAARTGQPLLLGDAPGEGRRYPSANPPRWLAEAGVAHVLPVAAGSGRPAAAVVYAGWPPGPAPSTATQAALGAIVTLLAHSLERVQHVRRLSEERFREALEAILDFVYIGEAVRDETGTIVDFRMAWVSSRSRDAAGRGPAEIIGRRGLELYPDWKPSGMFDAFVDVVQTGRPLQFNEVASRVPGDGRDLVSFWRLNAVRLGDGYICTARDVTEEVRDRERIREAAEAERRERQAVDLLQDAALRPSPTLPGLTFAAGYLPATLAVPVGGDWYDAFPVDRGAALVIGDVAGHGPEAAALMIQLRNMVRGLAIAVDRPEAMLRALNAQLVGAWPAGMFATCLIAVVDTVTGATSLASAGHPAPLRAGRDGCRYLDVVPGPPLGVVAGAGFPLLLTSLDGGATLVLFTDGLVETPGRSYDSGLGRLAEAVRSAPPGSDLEAVCEWVLQARSEPARRDDACLLLARLSGDRPGGRSDAEHDSTAARTAGDDQP